MAVVGAHSIRPSQARSRLGSLGCLIALNVSAFSGHVPRTAGGISTGAATVFALIFAPLNLYLLNTGLIAWRRPDAQFPDAHLLRWGSRFAHRYLLPFGPGQRRRGDPTTHERARWRGEID